MIRFTNDYSEGAHPRILKAMGAANTEGNFGYSTDPHCENARQMIRDAIGRPDSAVHFLVGGTQTNTVCICAALRPHQAVIAATTGHVCVHETGAIEASGHKCVTAPGTADGKLTPEAIRAVCAAHPDEHMVQPKLVYISNTTEVGGVYTGAELAAIRKVCDELGLLLYLDGARLGSALAAGGATLTELGALCDIFSIGGTKNGALFGEAVCIQNPAIAEDFRYIMKQRGGMLAKGRLLGLQFSTILDDDLWLQAGAHANEQAARLSAGLKELGYDMVVDSPTNQLFPILENSQIARLEQEFSFEHWAAVSDTHTAVRFVTSWATKPEAVDALLAALRR